MEKKTENNDHLFIIGAGQTRELFKVRREGEYDCRIIFDKNFVTLAFENETENSIELVVKVK